MATNRPVGDNSRVGAVRGRSQVYNPTTGLWTKRDAQTGKFMDVKTSSKPRNAEYVLLHTLSHMLIKEMSMQSGYSSSALHERIYSSENMCGILIYTGAADKEGSLGGLVELGEMNKFLPLLKGALENGLTCTTDPECFMKNPTSERLNGAACHSCTMISETACENGNRLLDRALVVPVPEHEEMGYFRELVRDLCGIQV